MQSKHTSLGMAPPTVVRQSVSNQEKAPWTRPRANMIETVPQHRERGVHFPADSGDNARWVWRPHLKSSLGSWRQASPRAIWGYCYWRALGLTKRPCFTEEDGRERERGSELFCHEPQASMCMSTPVRTLSHQHTIHTSEI